MNNSEPTFHNLEELQTTGISFGTVMLKRYVDAQMMKMASRESRESEWNSGTLQPLVPAHLLRSLVKARRTAQTFVQDQFIFDGYLIKWLRGLLKVCDPESSFRTAKRVADEFRSVYNSWSIDLGPALQYPNKDVFKSIRRGRALFVTNTGLIGLGSKQLELGDQLFVLNSGKAPYLLRPSTCAENSESRYTLVGDCLVRELLNGEAVNSPYAVIEPVILV